MSVNRGFSTPNYGRYLSHDIRQTIESMTDEQKQTLLEDIRTRKAFFGHNEDVCQYVESLLDNKRPKVGLSTR